MTHKLTIIKVCNHDFKPTTEDLERWRRIFEDAEANIEEINKGLVAGDIEIVTGDMPDKNDEHYLTLVKLGGDDIYNVTPADLEKWRELLEQAETDPDFKIITHSAVSIEQIKINDMKIVTVE
jgi:hypothetical protein